MIHQLKVGELVKVEICAIEPSSTEKLAVNLGEIYHFTCDESQLWYDKGIPSSPLGYSNFWANLFGMRVKYKTPCFCLCGFYNETEGTGFAIGKDLIEPIAITGSISFFANDTKSYYKNNSGSVWIDITRLE